MLEQTYEEHDVFVTDIVSHVLVQMHVELYGHLVAVKPGKEVKINYSSRKVSPRSRPS